MPINWTFFDNIPAYQYDFMTCKNPLGCPLNFQLQYIIEVDFEWIKALLKSNDVYVPQIDFLFYKVLPFFSNIQTQTFLDCF